MHGQRAAPPDEVRGAPDDVVRSGGKVRTGAREFDPFGRGVISLSSLVYFVMIILVGLYMSMVLIGARHWYGGRYGHSLVGHFLIRSIALLVIALGIAAAAPAEESPAGPSGPPDDTFRAVPWRIIGASSTAATSAIVTGVPAASFAIHVDSAPGAGSCFRVQLPRVLPQSEKDRRSETPSP